MKKTLILSAAAALVAMSTPAQAQRTGIIVVDTDRILSECTACRAASTTLQGQETQLTQRAQALDAQLKPERDAIQAAVRALGTRQPDAALQQRITAYQTREQQARTELENRQRQLQSTVAHVRQQVGSRAAQITEQVRARRQAAVAIPKSGVIATDNSVDVTSEVLAALNQQLPAVSVTPLPQQQQAQPQGR